MLLRIRVHKRACLLSIRSVIVNTELDWLSREVQRLPSFEGPGDVVFGVNVDGGADLFVHEVYFEEAGNVVHVDVFFDLLEEVFQRVNF